MATVLALPIELLGKNQLVGLHRSRPWGVQYKRYRDSIQQHVLAALGGKRPRYERCTITITIYRKRLLDVDSKYAAASVLLDVLQRVNVLPDDTDGEHGNKGVIASYTVRQVQSAESKVVIEIEGV